MSFRRFSGMCVRRVLAACVLVGSLACAPAALAEGDVRALFVGVSDYKNGAEGAPISDLKGAPNDIDMIRRAVLSRHKLAGERTLLGPEATRAGIMAAIRAATDDAKAGDTFLFYFSGHGRRFVTRVGDQPSGYNVTIAAYDAVPPARIRPDRNYAVGDIGDVFDREINLLLEEITARGVNVVTIFDSCNSGTATRSLLRPRAGSKMIAAPEGTLRLDEAPAPAATTRAMVRTTGKAGYRVHFAAAPDGEVARENPVLEDGKEVWRSDFTVAFSTALLEARAGVTYEELLNATRSKLVQSGAAQQELRTDGDLLVPFLGEAGGNVRLFEVAREKPGAWRLKGGTLSGVAVGSEFALYPSLPEALDEKAQPIARATVKTADAWSAQLAAQGPTAAGPEASYARETRRSFSRTLLKVGIVYEGAPTPAGRKIEADLRDQLKGLSAVKIVSSDSQIGFVIGAGGDVRLVTADMREIKTYHDPSLPGLGKTIKDLAQYYTLFSLDDGGQGPAVRFEAADSNCDGLKPEPFEREAGEPALIQGQTLHLREWNDGEQPLWFYVFNLGNDHSIALISATRGPVAPGKCYSSRHPDAFGNGRDHLLMIASTQPLPHLATLEQDTVRSAGGPPLPAPNPLQQLLLDTKVGTRSAGGSNVDVGAWSVRRLNYTVRPPKQP